MWGGRFISAIAPGNRRERKNNTTTRENGEKVGKDEITNRHPHLWSDGKLKRFSYTYMWQNSFPEIFILAGQSLLLLSRFQRPNSNVFQLF